MFAASDLLVQVGEALGGPPAMLQSAYHESSRGTLPHVDFNPIDPAGPMIGAWVALADVGPDAGRFFVVPGSHDLPRDEAFRRFADRAWAGYRAAFVAGDGPWTETESAAAWSAIEAAHGLQRVGLHFGASCGMTARGRAKAALLSGAGRERDRLAEVRACGDEHPGGQGTLPERRHPRVA